MYSSFPVESINRPKQNLVLLTFLVLRLLCINIYYTGVWQLVKILNVKFGCGLVAALDCESIVY